MSLRGAERRSNLDLKRLPRSFQSLAMTKNEVYQQSQYDNMNKNNELWKKTYKKNPNFVARMIDDEMILVPIKRAAADLERFYCLNELGRFIWDLIDEKRSLNQIKDNILENFEVGKEKAEADLNKFITEIVEIGGIVEIT